MVEIAIVTVDRTKAWIELNSLIAIMVVWRVNVGCDRSFDEVEGSIKQHGDCPVNVLTGLEC